MPIELSLLSPQLKEHRKCEALSNLLSPNLHNYIHTLASKVASLNIIDRLSHISICDKEQGFEGLLCHFYFLSLDNSLQIQLHFVVSQFVKPQDNAPALNGLNNLR